jgi:hypothetical protein
MIERRNGMLGVIHAQNLDTSSVAQCLDRGLKGRLPFPLAVFLGRADREGKRRPLLELEPWPISRHRVAAGDRSRHRWDIFLREIKARVACLWQLGA